MTNKEKFLSFVTSDNGKTIKKNRQRIKWRWLIRIKNNIHLWYLTLRDKHS